MNKLINFGANYDAYIALHRVTRITVMKNKFTRMVVFQKEYPL